MAARKTGKTGKSGKTKPKAVLDRRLAPRPADEVSRAVIARAELVCSALKQAVATIRDPKAGEREWAESGWPREDDASRVAKATTFINEMYAELFEHGKARPWMMFVRAIDHAARTANETAGAEYDAERARIARELYRREYPEFEEKLTDTAVKHALSAWRKPQPKGGKPWLVVREALKCFLKDPPTAETLSKEWRDKFPHHPWNARTTKR